jgi:glycosyltransferase involved in cell wall biosynthesis
MNPQVSIVIPTYNRAHLIGETIQSVIDQTFKDWEMIIVDDGSDDDTEEVVNAIASEKIHYFKIEHTGNLGKVRNYGIQKSKGVYIAFLDSDDLWKSEKLFVQIELLKKNPPAKFSFSNSEQFGDGAIITPKYNLFFTGNIFHDMVVKHQYTICMTSLIFEKSILKDVGLLNETWKGGADVEFFYRLAHQVDCVFTNEKLACIRKHGQSTSQFLGDLSYIELLEMYKIFRADGWFTRREYKMLSGKIFYRMGLDNRQRGSRKMAIRDFARYLSLQPLDWKGWVRVMQALFNVKNS